MPLPLCRHVRCAGWPTQRAVPLAHLRAPRHGRLEAGRAAWPPFPTVVPVHRAPFELQAGYAVPDDAGAAPPLFNPLSSCPTPNCILVPRLIKSRCTNPPARHRHLWRWGPSAASGFVQTVARARQGWRHYGLRLNVVSASGMVMWPVAADATRSWWVLRRYLALTLLPWVTGVTVGWRGRLLGAPLRLPNKDGGVGEQC
ncbi:hypothetical protein I4F81_008761 [Pyropia yezoensis]|uniref:Uncharacterized protein n=1 Tax=Pyropia yezoensis TaxID=2788 RepID=A0ACC3C921_PYRYE|nr:hypothetical protein I4F81_008761 [Neopyropia yezoensis]